MFIHEMSESGPDIIYALRNEAMPRLVKIGRTSRDMTARMWEVYGTGVPLSFECIIAREVEEVMDTVKKQWEELILAMEGEEESTRHEAGSAYTARGGEDPEFKEKDEMGRWWKAWTTEIRRLAGHFEAGEWPEDAETRDSRDEATSGERPRRRRGHGKEETLLGATMNGTDLHVESKQDFYQKAFMAVWQNAGGDIHEAQRLWASKVYPGKEMKGGRVYIADADVTILGTAWKNMKVKLDDAARRGAFEGSRITATTETAGGDRKVYQWPE